MGGPASQQRPLLGRVVESHGGPLGLKRLSSCVVWGRVDVEMGFSVAHNVPPRKQFAAVFSFLYFLKIKISKIYVRFEIFQKYPRSPPHRATGPKINFFSSNLQRGPWKKKGWSPPNGRQGGPVAPFTVNQWAQPTGAAGGLSPPLGRPG